MVTLGRKVRGPAQYTQEWYDLRYFDPGRKDGPPFVIGASEAAAAVGQSRWSTPAGLWHIKRQTSVGQLLDSRKGFSIKARLGSAFEAGILDLTEELLPEVFPDHSWPGDGIKIRRNIPIHWLQDHPTIAASPDGIVRKMRGTLVDSKATFMPTSALAKYFGEEGTDSIPDEMLWQGQQQLAVFGGSEVFFPVFMSQLGSIKIFRVERNEDLIDILVQREEQLSEWIVTGEEPKPDWGHPETERILAQKYDFMEGAEIELSDEGKQAFAEINLCKALIREIEDRKTIAENQLTNAMAGAEIAKMPGLGIELVQRLYPETVYTDKDVEDLRAKIGQIKRKSYQKRWSRKIKPAK